MPAIFAKIIWGALLYVIGHIVFKVLVGLGLAVVTFVGVSSSMDWIINYGIQHLRGLPAEIIGLLAYMKVGVCISMLTSAIALRAALTFSGVDTIKRFVLT